MILIGSNFLRLFFRSKVEIGFLDLGALTDYFIKIYRYKKDTL